MQVLSSMICDTDHQVKTKVFVNEYINSVLKYFNSNLLEPSVFYLQYQLQYFLNLPRVLFFSATYQGGGIGKQQQCN